MCVALFFSFSSRWRKRGKIKVCKKMEQCNQIYNGMKTIYRPITNASVGAKKSRNTLTKWEEKKSVLIRLLFAQCFRHQFFFCWQATTLQLSMNRIYQPTRKQVIRLLIGLYSAKFVKCTTLEYAIFKWANLRAQKSL